MNTYYVTLVRELSGYCVAAVAPDEWTLRKYLAEHYGHLWCSVYTEPPSETVIGQAILLWRDSSFEYKED